jgi:hypothetical protein
MKTHITNLLGVMVAFLTPIQGLLILMVLMVLMDTMMAIYVSINKKGIKSFTSYKLFNIIPKLTFYLSSIVIGYFIDLYIIQEFLSITLPISKLIGVLLTWVELKSIDEHIINLGHKSMWVVLKEFIRKVSSLKTNIKKLNE